MGTRADFYVRRGEKAEWLGSVAWDGYPEGIVSKTAYDPSTDDCGNGDAEEGEPTFGAPELFDNKDEGSFRETVNALIERRRDGTFPKDGWPWPWEDSQTTDYTYAFDGDRVWISCFGCEWIDYETHLKYEAMQKAHDDWDEEGEEPPESPELEDKAATFPNMKDQQNVTLGKRSGVLVFEAKG